MSLLALFFLIFPPALFAKGKTETASATPLNPTWVLCVTAFDVASLPVSQQVTGSILARQIASTMGTDVWRRRPAAETALLAETAKEKTVREAAAKIAAKQKERDALIFQGLTKSKLRKDTKTKDKELADLYKAYNEARAAQPLVEEKPLVAVTADNTAAKYPAPPAEGGEFLFCTGQKADGFLAGSVSLYHERFYVTLKLWTLEAKAYVWNTDMLFDDDEINDAALTLAAEIADAVSRVRPAVINVTATPDTATIVINQHLAGTGATGDVELDPSKAALSVSASGYEGQQAEIPLEEGEAADVSVSLVPLETKNVTVSAAEKASRKKDAAPPRNASSENISVYRGALYAGKAPYALSLPVGPSEAVSVESAPIKNKGDTAVTPQDDGHAKAPLGGFAVLAATEERGVAVAGGGGALDKSGNLVDIRLEPPPAAGLVEKRRKQFYGANARFWISLPITMFISGLATSTISSHNSIMNNRGYVDPKMTQDARTLQYMSWGAIGLTVSFLAESLVRFVIYAHDSAKAPNPFTEVKSASVPAAK